MNTLLLDRLDMAEAALVRAGSSRPSGFLYDFFTTPQAPATSAAAPAVTPAAKASRPRKLTKEQAERMARDLDGYDGRIKGGRLREA